MRPSSAAIAVLVSVASTAALAQQPAGSWDAIAQAKGKSIVIVRNDGNSHSGTLEQVSDGALTLRSQQRSILIRQDEIRQVHSQTGRSRKRGALWGLAIGAGGGAIFGAAIAQSCTGEPFCISPISRGQVAAIGAAAGGAVGTLVGTLVGGKRKKVLLYDSTVSGPAH